MVASEGEGRVDSGSSSVGAAASSALAQIIPMERRRGSGGKGDAASSREMLVLSWKAEAACLDLDWDWDSLCLVWLAVGGWITLPRPGKVLYTTSALRLLYWLDMSTRTAPQRARASPRLLQGLWPQSGVRRGCCPSSPRPTASSPSNLRLLRIHPWTTVSSMIRHAETGVIVPVNVRYLVQLKTPNAIPRHAGFLSHDL
ncbi:hypothetical protein BC567DRAFT_227550 [Phyllosticta citribraziliensis]